MKLINHIAPVLESLSLAPLGGVLLWFAMPGRYASFVPPSVRLGIIVSSVGLFACALASSAHVDAGEHKSADTATSYRAMTCSLVALLAAALPILPFHVSPSKLATGVIGVCPTSGGSTIDADTDDSTGDTPGTSNDAANKGTNPASGSSSQNAGAGQASSSGGLELATSNSYSRVEEMVADEHVHDGQRIELTGFVLSTEAASAQTPIPCVTDEESFVVARMVIWCYAADAYPVEFTVWWVGPAPAASSWVYVSGTPRVRSEKTLVIGAGSITPAQTPNPEFMVRTR